MRYIGLHGFAGVGKDTVADLLADYGYERVAFGDKVREALYTLNPIVTVGIFGAYTIRDLVDFWGWDHVKREHSEVRKMLQVMGTEIGRDLIGQDTWVDLALSSIHPDKKYVFTDIRFDNEYSAIKRSGGIFIKIYRPGVGPVNSHKSDTGLPDPWFDVILHNDGTLDDLKKTVSVLMEREW